MNTDMTPCDLTPDDRKLAALKRLEAWAAQDPTGPVEAGGVSVWVRSQIQIALGNQIIEPLHLQPRSVSLMELELIQLRNEVHARREGIWIEKSAFRFTPNDSK